MYHNILVPVVFDGDHDRSGPIKLAGILATPNAKVTFLHVVEQVPPYVMSYIAEDLQVELRAGMQKELDDIAAHIPGATGQVVQGHSGRTILDYADQNDIDLIIVASHRPGVQDYFLGGTASHVVRHAPCAVHVVR